MAEERVGVQPGAPPEETTLVRTGYPRPAYPEAYGQGYGSSESSEQDIFQLREVWHRVRKHRWLIFSLALIITTIVTIEVFRSKSLYQASATIEFEQNNQTMMRSEGVFVQTEDAANPWDLPLLMKTKIRAMQSRPLLEDVVVSLKLDQNPKFLEVTSKYSILDALRQLGGQFIRQRRETRPMKEEDLNVPSLQDKTQRSVTERDRLSPYVAVLAANLSAEPLEETRMLVVSYRHTDPALAAQIANTISQAFIIRTFQNKTERYTNATDWLDRSTRELKARVEQAEQALANYSRDKNFFTTEGKENNLTAGKLAQMYEQMTRAETERMIKQSLYEEVRQGRVEQLPEAFANQQTLSLQNKLDELKTTAAQLNARFGPENPRVADVQTQIRAAEEQITVSRQRLEAKLKADYDRAIRDEQSLRTAFNRAKSEAVNQNQAAIQYSLLRQAVETNKALYTDFLTKTAHSKIEVAEQHSNLRVIDPAVTPVTPVGPMRFRAILLSLLLSLIAGVGLSMLLEFFDNSISNVEDVTRYAQLPLLAVIPTITARASRLLAAGSGLKKLVNNSASVHTETKPQSEEGSERPSTGPSMAPIVAFVRHSTVSEAYRMLRTSVMLSTAGGPPKTILFTSGQPSEGKTTTTVNTAIALARQGSSVIIVDADLRRPMIHRLFNIESRQGLSTYLSKDVEIDKLVQKLPMDNLSILPCGPIPPNPAELVGSERMRTLLRELSLRYDHVLVDSPPVIHVTDPVVLSTMVDGVILVVCGGKTTRQVVRRVRQELTAVNARMLGVVLNNVDVRREGYDDYYYYRYNSDQTEEWWDNQPKSDTTSTSAPFVTRIERTQ